MERGSKLMEGKFISMETANFKWSKSNWKEGESKSSTDSPIAKILFYSTTKKVSYCIVVHFANCKLAPPTPFFLTVGKRVLICGTRNEGYPCLREQLFFMLQIDQRLHRQGRVSAMIGNSFRRRKRIQILKLNTSSRSTSVMFMYAFMPQSYISTGCTLRKQYCLWCVWGMYVDHWNSCHDNVD
jgi:hypothetical protein